VTLLNISENIRFKKGGVRFWGYLSIFDYDAPEGLPQGQKRKRALELHHDCCRIISSEMLNFCEQRNRMQAADGSIYEVVPRLAFVAADFQQIQQNVALVGRGCHVCECPYEELDRTGMQWPLRDLRNIMESLYSLADEVLDENGKIRFGKVKVIKEWEQQAGMKFLENGFAPLLTAGFDICLFSPRDLLHHILLGLSGQYVVNSIIHLLIFDENGLANPLFWESSPGHAALMSDVKAVAIWNRLSKRLSSIEEDEAGFTISSKMAKHFLKV
jgi:hypothetical protein